MAKKKKNFKKVKRFCVFGLVCFAINGYLTYSLFDIWKEVYDKKEENKTLAIKLDNLKEEEEKLKVEVNKLQNPEYVARYAREKYLYSKENEYIIRIK